MPMTSAKLSLDSLVNIGIIQPNFALRELVKRAQSATFLTVSLLQKQTSESC